MLNTGGPVLMPWLHHVEGVLQAWYPGQQFGAALASVLFGDSDPGGRLPITFPASDAQGPAPPTRPERYPGVNGEQRYDEGIFVGYRWYDQFRQQPLFPFGYGLSYADFRFGDLRLRSDHGGVTASTRVTNTSRRAGSTVAQAYLSFPRSAGEPPRQLKGYEKVQLAPGRSAVVSFRLGPRRPGLLRRGRAPAGRRRRALHAVGGQLVARPARERELRAGRPRPSAESGRRRG